MGQTSESGRHSDDIEDLIAAAATMPASRFILAVAARGHDPAEVLDRLVLAGPPSLIE